MFCLVEIYFRGGQGVRRGGKIIVGEKGVEGLGGSEAPCLTLSLHHLSLED